MCMDSVSPDQRDSATAAHSSPKGEDRRAPGLTEVIRSIGGESCDGEGPQLRGLFRALHAMAAKQLRSQRPSHTLQPTALVNEAYLRIFGKGPADFADRRHFFRTAAVAMRTALVDHERRRRVARASVPLDENEMLQRGCQELDLLVLDDRLQRMAQFDPELVRLVELRVFALCTTNEIAAILDVAPRTVEREWSLARSWLRREFLQP